MARAWRSARSAGLARSGASALRGVRGEGLRPPSSCVFAPKMDDLAVQCCSFCRCAGGRLLGCNALSAILRPPVTALAGTRVQWRSQVTSKTLGLNLTSAVAATWLPAADCLDVAISRTLGPGWACAVHHGDVQNHRCAQNGGLTAAALECLEPTQQLDLMSIDKTQVFDRCFAAEHRSVSQTIRNVPCGGKVCYVYFNYSSNRIIRAAASISAFASQARHTSRRPTWRCGYGGVQQHDQGYDTRDLQQGRCWQERLLGAQAQVL
jgi:hypothetical protein